jgi:hypothetical protein
MTIFGMSPKGRYEVIVGSNSSLLWEYCGKKLSLYWFTSFSRLSYLGEPKALPEEAVENHSA